MGGKKDPSEKDVKAILSSVGIEADPQNLSIVVEQLKGKNVFQLIAEGQALLADMDMPTGGGGPAVGAGGGAGVAAAVADEPVEEKKPVVESSDETDSDMGMGLFDD